MKDFLQEEESDQHLQDLIQMKADIMMKKISELKEPYKQVIQMREINKMVYKDIAADLGDDVTFTILISNEVEELPMELSKVYSILDSDGKNVTDFNLIEGDTKKTPFFTQINLNPGSYQIFGRRPKPLSTIKSQIRNGRALLIEATEKEYRILDEMYK
jgi:hypothetical protein